MFSVLPPLTTRTQLRRYGGGANNTRGATLGSRVHARVLVAVPMRWDCGSDSGSDSAMQVASDSAGSRERIPILSDSEHAGLEVESGGDSEETDGSGISMEGTMDADSSLERTNGGVTPHSGGVTPRGGGLAPLGEGVAPHRGGVTAGGGGLTPPGSAATADVATCFSWATVTLSFLARALGPERIRMSLLAAPMAISTHFSGLGTVELAVTCLAAAAPEALGFPLQLTSSFACESDPACQHILSVRLPRTACLFTNILHGSRAATQVFEMAAPKARVDFPAARQAIMSEAVVLRRPCKRHLEGPCLQPFTDGDISGSPCTPWSAAGLRGRERDPLIALLLVWCRWLLDTKLRWAIHENVRTVDRHLLQDLVSSLYDVVFLETSPGDAGFSLVRRPRLYAVCLLRGRVEVVASISAIYRELREAFALREKATFLACLVASGEELWREENKLRLRRKLPPLAPGAATSDWTYLLTPRQAASLRAYRERYPEAGAVNLGHNGDVRPSFARDGQLPTLTRNAGGWWVPARKRFMTCKELAVASGYPVTAELARAARVPVDACADSYVAGQVGNCMHVANVGSVVAVALACIRDPQ